jgi:hypothetical protein
MPLLLLGSGDNGSDVNGGRGWTLGHRLLGARIEANAQSVQSTQHERQFGTWMPVLNLYDPLPANADALGKRRLVELELLASIANDGADVCGCANEHD